MIYRQATVDDADQVVALGLRFYETSPYTKLLTVDPDRIRAAFHVALDRGVVYVAEAEHRSEGGELVGFIGFVAHVHVLSGDRFAEEMGWYVDPALRKGRVGPTLHDLGIQWAVANECKFVVMLAPAGTAVGHYYDSLGYQPIETYWMKRVA